MRKPKKGVGIGEFRDLMLAKIIAEISIHVFGAGLKKRTYAIYFTTIYSKQPYYIHTRRDETKARLFRDFDRALVFLETECAQFQKFTIHLDPKEN